MRAHQPVGRLLMKADWITVFPNISIRDRRAPALRRRPRSLKREGADKGATQSGA